MYDFEEARELQGGCLLGQKPNILDASVSAQSSQNLRFNGALFLHRKYDMLATKIADIHDIDGAFRVNWLINMDELAGEEFDLFLEYV